MGNMFLIQVAVFVLFCFNYCYCASTRVWHYRNCGKQGFTCIPRSKTLIFECPVKTREYHIYVNELNGPSYLESLIIKNCNTLTILLRCTQHKHEKKKLKYLEISNIKRLKIQRYRNYPSQLPPTVVFENITFIENIPSYSFSPIDKKLNKVRCILPQNDFHSVYFRNVIINTVYSNAFYMPNKFGNITFTNVRINSMQTSSLTVKHAEDGVFLMDKCTVKAVNPFSFRIVGKKATFSESKFVDISSSGINATTETFYFINNSVNALRSHALSVLAKDVFILNNRFESLKAGAFEQIGPGKFENLKFTYDFIQNSINFMEDDCLQPDLIAYENVPSEISFSRNGFSCFCDKLGWLLAKMHHGNFTSPEKTFYESMFDGESGNTCSSSCNLPLLASSGMIKNGNCMQNITVTWLCQNKDESTTVTTPSAPTEIYTFTTRTIGPPTESKFVVTSESADSVTSSTTLINFNLPNKLISTVVREPTFTDTDTKPSTTVTTTSLLSEKYVFTTRTIAPSTAPQTKSKFIGTSVSPNNVTTSTFSTDFNLSNELISTVAEEPTFNNTDTKLSTTVNMIPILKTSHYQLTKFNTTLRKPIYTTPKSILITSVWTNKLTTTNTSVISNAFSSKLPQLEGITFKAPILTTAVTKVPVPESVKLKSSAENDFVSFFLLVCAVLCIVMNY